MRHASECMVGKTCLLGNLTPDEKSIRHTWQVRGPNGCMEDNQAACQESFPAIRYEACLIVYGRPSDNTEDALSSLQGTRSSCSLWIILLVKFYCLILVASYFGKFLFEKFAMFIAGRGEQQPYLVENGKKVFVPEMVPELIVPDLNDCKVRNFTYLLFHN